MKTSRTAGLIVGMVAGAAALLLPGATADGLAAERAASQALAATGVSPIDLILDQPVIALLVVLALGLLVGQIKIRGVMLGMVGHLSGRHAGRLMCPYCAGEPGHQVPKVGRGRASPSQPRTPRLKALAWRAIFYAAGLADTRFVSLTPWTGRGYAEA